jgi:hypothetical protein
MRDEHRNGYYPQRSSRNALASVLMLLVPRSALPNPLAGCGWTRVPGFAVPLILGAVVIAKINCGRRLAYIATSMTRLFHPTEFRLPLSRISGRVPVAC